MNIFDECYSRIEDFVSRPENSRLKAGTGEYSTLFRGSLHGSSVSSEVAKAIKTQPVKVLWLGSNPNCPESLKLIKNNNGIGHYERFVAQKQSGHFSEIAKSQSGKPQIDWDPINNPTYGWQFYTDIFDRIFGRSSVLMANYVPWGSENFPELINELFAIDETLLHRVLEFSTLLNKRVIECIKPEIIVVPKSLCVKRLSDSHLFQNSIPESTKTIRVDAKVPFIFEVRDTVIENLKVKLLISPHPSYTSRVGKEHRAYVQNEIMKALQGD